MAKKLGDYLEIRAYFKEQVPVSNKYGLEVVCNSILEYRGKAADTGKKQKIVGKQSINKHSARRVADQLKELSELTHVNGHFGKIVDTLYEMVQETKGGPIQTRTDEIVVDAEPCGWVVGQAHRVYHSGTPKQKAELNNFWKRSNPNYKDLVELLTKMKNDSRLSADYSGRTDGSVYRARPTELSGHSASRRIPSKPKGHS